MELLPVYSSCHMEDSAMLGQYNCSFDSFVQQAMNYTDHSTWQTDGM